MNKSIHESQPIHAARRTILEDLAEAAKGELETTGRVRLVFVCTHNSRRSQLAQVWANHASQLMAAPIECFSGGTESTFVADGVVEALRRSGWTAAAISPPPNPTLRFTMDEVVVECVSKRFDDPRNPSARVIAVMVCDEADRSCPAMPGAIRRVALPFQDPKRADGTNHERRTYDESSAEIAREMRYLVHRIHGD